MSNKLSEQARLAKRNYQNEWRKKNPDKLRQYTATYWEKKASKVNDNETLEQKIFRLHGEGFSLREIAAKTNISHVSVSRILKSK